MTGFRCERCTRPLTLPVQSLSVVVPCPACGHLNLKPITSEPSFGPPRETAPRQAATGWVWIAVAACVALAAMWGFQQFAVPSVSIAGASGQVTGPADARQRQILEANAGKPGDADLMARYAEINGHHFSGALPTMPVRWDKALADVGQLSGNAFSLQGMFGQVGGESLIVINASLRDDVAARDRALSHEMVHAYLFMMGEESTTHGPAFQTVLRRLSIEGAFQGISSTLEERTALRAWLDAETARLEGERISMEATDRDLALMRADLDRNPSAADYAFRRQQFNTRLFETNIRVQRHREAVAHLQSETDRYNLMLAYPDGLAADNAAAASPAPPPTPAAGSAPGR